MDEQSPKRSLWSHLKHAFAVPDEARLSPDEHRWLERIADRTVERGLAEPAVLLLRSAQPLTYVGSQVVVFFRPLISLVAPQDQIDRVAALLGRRPCTEALAQMIEERAERLTGDAAHGTPISGRKAVPGAGAKERPGR